jgi:metal-responsive CopG/Arc/MetJ family transcriptional regulator
MAPTPARPRYRSYPSDVQINLKLPKEMLEVIDRYVNEHGIASRTEFILDAVDAAMQPAAGEIEIPTSAIAAALKTPEAKEMLRDLLKEIAFDRMFK